MINDKIFSIQKIGIIHLGVDGSDEYVLLTSNEGATAKDVKGWMMDRVYYETNQEAGGYYCNHVTVMPHPVFDDQFVCTIHHRYDV